MSSFRVLILIPLLILACGRQESVQQPVNSAARPQPRPAIVPVSAPVAAPAAVSAPEPRPCPSRPNILIISLDTLRADATQLDPRSRNRTPVLDRLRRRGVNFTTAYTTWDSTPPAHFSMLTGYINAYPESVDVPEASIAYQLQKLGYRSFGVAANYNLSPKAQRIFLPFDEFVNLNEIFDSSPDEIDRWCLRVEAGLKARHATRADWFNTQFFYAAPNVVHYAERKLDRLRGKQPFLGFLNFMDTHDPYMPSPKFYDYSQDPPNLDNPRSRALPLALKDPEVIPDPERRAYFVNKIAQAQGRNWSVTLDLTKQELDAYRRRYYAEARELDAGLGLLVSALERRGLLDSTILVFTADHGELFGEGDLITHSFNNSADREKTNRVNLLFVFPPCYGFKPVQIKQYCTIADIVPTLYDLLGVDASPLWTKTIPGNYGRSLLPLMTRMTPERPPAVTAAVNAPPVPPAQRKQQDEEALRRFRALGYIQ